MRRVAPQAGSHPTDQFFDPVFSTSTAAASVSTETRLDGFVEIIGH